MKIRRAPLREQLTHVREVLISHGTVAFPDG
jgi:hypothetical protein